MSTEADIVERLSKSLKPFWSHTQKDAIGDAMAEITKLRAQCDAAAWDMRERCAEHIRDAGGEAIDWLAESVRALPLLATDRETPNG